MIDKKQLCKIQQKNLSRLLAELIPANAYFAPLLQQAGLNANSTIEEFCATMPFTFKKDIVADQTANPPYGTNLTYPLEKYTRFNQTSATTGTPLRWLDTTDSWQWMLDNWKQVFNAAGVDNSDKIFYAFSFGPFLGFWTAFEAGTQLGCLCLPGGGLSSLQRLKTILDNRATVLCCTPTYAQRLAEVAAEENIELSQSKIQTIIVAGEPGGSVAAVRQNIEKLWPGAKLYDHHGMTEVGPVSYPNANNPGILHIIESSYIAEIIDPKTDKAVAPGEVGELALTTLGRHGSPLLRYRTGDLVKQSLRSTDELGSTDLALEGGIIGRADDMVLIRGRN